MVVEQTQNTVAYYLFLAVQGVIKSMALLSKHSTTEWHLALTAAFKNKAWVSYPWGHAL